MKKEIVNNIIKETFFNLKKQDIIAMPNAYHKEFCKVAKKFDLTINECEEFKNFVNQLHESEQTEIKSKNITTIHEMIPMLLNKISKDKINTLSEIFDKSMSPSISIEMNEDLKKFSVKIGNSPALIFEDEIQKEMQKFIIKRFEADKKVVKQKTADIAKLVTLMGQCFNDAIDSSGMGSVEVSSIKSKIQSIDIKKNGMEELSQLQWQLVYAAGLIEDRMSNVGAQLTNGKSDIEKLKEKINKLETELDKTKKESIKDHLTGLLTRKAFEESVKTIEHQFLRNDTQFAVVFFDLDYFKKVNDTYGHKAGDIILSTFAKVLQNSTRDVDIVGRYGGEEFVAIIHFNLKRELLKYLKRIKAIINENEFLYEENKIKVTFSAGVAIRNNHKSYDSTIQKADILLYKAKESGRNKIIIEDGTTI